jgi:hypothetical protein
MMLLHDLIVMVHKTGTSIVRRSFRDDLSLNWLDGGGRGQNLAQLLSLP